MTMEQLKKALHGLTASKITQGPRKTAQMNCRVSERDFDSISKTAQALGLSRADYLVGLHYFALPKLERSMRKAVKE